jgi:hypothetical protein
MTTIELQDDQVAIILNEDLSYEVYLPEGDEDDNVPGSALFALAVCVLMKSEDPLFHKVINEQIDEFLTMDLDEE